MKSIAKLNTQELKRRRAAILADLEQVEPALIRELALVDEALRVKQNPGGRYAHVGYVIDAIVLELEASGEWTSRGALADALIAGGFREGQDVSTYLIKNSMNHHVKTGKLQRVGDLIGLPDWPEPSTK